MGYSVSSNKLPGAVSDLISEEDWFASGSRVYYDPKHKKIVDKNETANNDDTIIAVFERVVLPENGLPDDDSTRRWHTLMPGFPDGSYGYAKVDHLLLENTTRDDNDTPRLYIEYVGQGDSDKPNNYIYSTVERADLVEAQWKAHGVKTTVVVTFDYSSIVMLELLQRQKERQSRGIMYPRIEHVLSINGGLYADGHSHPITTTPLLKTSFGRMGANMAQRSNFVFDTMLKPLYGKDYRSANKKVFWREIRETEKAIRRHRGTAFLSNAAGFVDEHKQNPARWNLSEVYENYCKDQGITIHLIGSKEDPFEPKQLVLARARLGSYAPNVKTEIIPGGHLSTAEQAALLVIRIEGLVRQEASNNQE